MAVYKYDVWYRDTWGPFAKVHNYVVKASGYRVEPDGKYSFFVRRGGNEILIATFPQNAIVGILKPGDERFKKEPDVAFPKL